MYTIVSFIEIFYIVRNFLQAVYKSRKIQPFFFDFVDLILINKCKKIRESIYIQFLREKVLWKKVKI